MPGIVDIVLIIFILFLKDGPCNFHVQLEFSPELLRQVLKNDCE